MEQRPTKHDPAREERRVREAALDKTLADTFPASDPLSTNPNPRDYSNVELEDLETPPRDVRRGGTTSRG